MPVVLGSDKTTVSVATGHTEYHPLYASVGNVLNDVRRAHQNAFLLIGFLAIPKSMLPLLSLCLIVLKKYLATKEYAEDADFRRFHHQLYHSSLYQILLPLRPHMTVPQVTRCADGHFRRAIYGLGPYIADYQEQVILAGIVQGWCPRYVKGQIF